MRSLDTLLKNKIQLCHAFNILLVANNIRKVAQLDGYSLKIFQKKNNFLKKFLVKNNIHFIENKNMNVVIIYNNNIKINNNKLSSSTYDSYYVGKLLDIGCVTKDFGQLYKRKKNAPFQVRFGVIKYYKSGTSDIWDETRDYFMAQMCVDDKTLSKSHKQITKFQKELYKHKLDNFGVFIEIDPQPLYYTNNGIPVFYKK